jgi:hypothetical protein
MRKSATDRSGWNIANGRLIRQVGSGPRFDEPLPPDKKDIVGTTALRGKIKAFGQRHGLREGEINAGYKTLTENGDYVSGPRDLARRLKWNFGLIPGVTEKQKGDLRQLIEKHKKR